MNNFNVLRIKRCILNKLFNTFSSNIIIRLNNNLTRNIAAEIEESQIKRVRIIKKLKSFTTELQTLNRLSRNKSAD